MCPYIYTNSYLIVCVCLCLFACQVVRSPAASPAVPAVLAAAVAAAQQQQQQQQQQEEEQGARRSDRCAETTARDVKGFLDLGDLGGLDQLSQPRRDAILRTMIELANKGIDSTTELGVYHCI